MPYLNTFLIILFMYVLLAESYDLLGGYTGYINMGHIAFFGIGAYTFGLLWNKGLPLYLSFLAGTLAAVIFAILISFPFFRLRGAYFSLAAFALVKLMEHLTLNLSSITHGSDGLKVLEGNRMIPMYYLSLLMVVAVIAVSYFITRSRLGLAMSSIREKIVIALNKAVMYRECGGKGKTKHVEEAIDLLFSYPYSGEFKPEIEARIAEERELLSDLRTEITGLDPAFKRKVEHVRDGVPTTIYEVKRWTAAYRDAPPLMSWPVDEPLVFERG